MDVQNSNVDYYNKMQDLQERLRRSEEERMHLQRQFDLLLQANQEKERARVSVVEARYKRFLDEDKRRRDRNSSLLQALDRIDSHTASLAAKTERMRSLRKHYEAFIAHSYPGWYGGIERSYCPLAAIAPGPNVMTRVTDVTGYDAESPLCYPDPSDHSETQYHALPSVTSKPYCPLASPLCRSDLAIASREDCPVVGRSSYRTGSAIRSASLSPSRVRDLTSQYEIDKSSSFRNHDVYTPSKSLDVGLSSWLKSDLCYPRRSDVISSPRPSHYLGDVPQGFIEENQTPYRPLSSTNHRLLDYDHGNSDIEIDQNTSGDLLNLSNLSLSDDGIRNESEIPDSPLMYSGVSYSTPRNFSTSKKSPSISLSFTNPPTRHHANSRDVFITKKSAALPPSIFTSSSPKSILSPRSKKDNVHRIFLSTDDLDSRRADAPLSPRRQKSTWQTLRPSYMTPAPRSTIRRSVTFTEPEYESPCMYRDEDVGLYSGAYGSLRRQPPSLPLSNWESTDHERYLREKQGREKDAFREKIERLKELIQENKDHELGTSGLGLGTTRESSFTDTKHNNHHQHEKSRENSLDRILKVSQSRRPSVARDLSLEPGSDSEEQLSQAFGETSKTTKGDDEALGYKTKNNEGDDLTSDTMSDKEQWSGQFNEKDEDAKEKVKFLETDGDTLNQTQLESLEFDDSFNQMPKESAVLQTEANNYNIEEEVLQDRKDHNTELTPTAFQSDSNNGHADDVHQKDLHTPGVESADFILKENQPNQKEKGNAYEELTSKESSDLKEIEPQHTQENDSHFKADQNTKIEDQKSFSNYPENYSYETDQHKQEWTANEDGNSLSTQQNMQYSYEQGDPSSTSFEGEKQDDSGHEQGSEFNAYSNEGEQSQQNYENYQSDGNQQPQMAGEYGEPGYETYQEPQQSTETTGVYKEYSEDPSQYQQNYQAYPEGQQYNEQQDQNYATGDQTNYQYEQDPSKAQYGYEGQDYNYQQEKDSYDYSQDPNYQQDSTYQQGQQYQQDQSYSQDQPYQQDPTYQQNQQDPKYQQSQQDPNYQQNQQDPDYQLSQPDANYQQSQQDPNYQQSQQYQESGYDGSQQYEGYQPGPDDVSEDTTPSADSNYQGQYQGGEATDQQQTLEQYRTLLGADPVTDPAYSDSSELENQMAAVVGQGGTSATSDVTEPVVTPPTPSTPSPASGTTKAKAAGKKKPQLTRKQSSINPANVEG